MKNEKIIMNDNIENEEDDAKSYTERVSCVTYEEAKENRDNPHYELYFNLFKIIKDICDILDISIPVLSIQIEPLYLYNEFGEVLDLVDAMVYKPCEIFGSDDGNILLRVSLDGLDEESIVGTLAHELRHIWQWCHRTDLPIEVPYGKDKLFNPAEIDADAFAIWFLCARCGAPIELAGMLACIDVINENRKAYQKRKERAKELLEEYN